MKKFIVMILAMVVMMTMTVATADFYGSENIWFDSIKTDFEKAVSEGEQIHSNVYLYEGLAYYVGAGMYLENLEYTGHKDAMWEVEDFLEGILKEEGAKHPQVEIMFAGQDEDGENIYEVTIMMMENLNEYQGEKSGNGYLGEGIEYYGIKSIGRIYF